ncbi:MAG TPA: hypothetical protein GX710_04915 [Clostridiales bacterium]|nr:hypothetical protein [Clostridiales bacterium]
MKGIQKKFNLNKYLALTRAGVLEALSFRANYMVSFFGNLVYLVVIYFLWKAIYNSSPQDIVNGMTFSDTFIYLVLATAMFNFLESFVVWVMSRDIQTGKIVVDLIKPMDYQLYTFMNFSGNFVTAFFITFMPTFLIVLFITWGKIAIGINLIFFLLSLVFASIINFCIDFIVGTICLYTESVWGTNIMKEVIVLLLSGATIPLAFFPDTLRKIVELLPFQAIYNLPLTVLTSKNTNLSGYFQAIGIQLFWVIIMILISRLFWKKSVKVITVNGG